MKHWRIEQMDWDAFDASKVDPSIVSLIKSASVVERNARDYTEYLVHVFAGDQGFIDAAQNWAEEEVQHGDALGKWAMLADPSWNYEEAFKRYRDTYRIDVDVDASIRGSRTGEMIARCMVETGTSSFYTSLADATDEPVLKAVCKQIAADEYRHFKLFYDCMHRYLKREKLGRWARLRIALSRVLESEDDELATAYHITNEPADMPYDHKRCISAYMSRALGFYQRKHLGRVVAMVLKTAGMTPHSRLQRFISDAAYHLIKWRQKTFARHLKTAS
ncbi:acyl-ACP desaturase [Saccharibacter sp. 17.LH.SD]|uniref:acyl-ACP desaturase n=1 Tax=Saccharibacter sp. 17.LH.SD TaxID=2689393 RepID=UPI00136AFD36|nr:ferritin-like domain-containing protein [Saccharibacter sp. 17.LH.SD]MXV44487.1 acyl-ACP desaturase [Saccharibacter sp. 17.LH.SD]